MKRQMSTILMGLAVVVGSAGLAWAHCQIPCGIFDDDLRFKSMLEHVETIEKSMQQITILEKEKGTNTNQVVRWVNNKDTHADELSEIITFYFMAQRVKPVPETDKAAYGKYVRQLTTLHQMVVLAMKAKQTTDLQNCSELRRLVAEFRKSYMGE